MTDAYDRDQERALREAVAAGRSPRCPACDVALDVRTVEPRPDVAYVRRRRWLVCSRCGRSLVVEAPRGGAR